MESSFRISAAKKGWSTVEVKPCKGGANFGCALVTISLLVGHLLAFIVTVLVLFSISALSAREQLCSGSAAASDPGLAEICKGVGATPDWVVWAVFAFGAVGYFVSIFLGFWVMNAFARWRFRSLAMKHCTLELSADKDAIRVNGREINGSDVYRLEVVNTISGRTFTYAEATLVAGSGLLGVATVGAAVAGGAAQALGAAAGQKNLESWIPKAWAVKLTESSGRQSYLAGALLEPTAVQLFRAIREKLKM